VRIRLTLGLDIQRHPGPQKDEPYVEPEHAPEVNAKGAFILDRRPAEDFDKTHRIGFLRNEEGIS